MQRVIITTFCAILLAALYGCGSSKKHNLVQNNSAAPSHLPKTLTPGFEGTWVVDMLCNGELRNGRFDYGLLEIEKGWGNSYSVDFFIFDKKRKNERYLQSNGKGIYIDIKADAIKDGKQLLFKVKKGGIDPSFSFNASLLQNGLVMQAEIKSETPCPSFVAYKIPISDEKVKRPELLTARSGKYPTAEECSNLYEWLYDIQGDVAQQGNRGNDRPKSVVYNENSFIQNLGISYRNWDKDRVRWFSNFSRSCRNVLSKSKDYRYKRLSYKFNNSTHRYLKFSKSKKSSDNLIWANFYFTLGAIEIAKIRNNLLYSELQELDDSENSLNRIYSSVTDASFPFNFLSNRAKSFYEDKGLSLYRDRLYTNLKSRISSIDRSTYSQTLAGLAVLKKDTVSIKNKIVKLDDWSRKDDLRKQYNGIINEHTQESLPDINKSITAHFSSDKLIDASTIISNANNLTQSPAYEGLSRFIDDYVASWIKEDINFIKAGLANASLDEITQASEYLASLPHHAQIGTSLKKARDLLQSSRKELPPLISSRVQALHVLAVGIIEASGDSYNDTETILETGFALAKEFEDSGYVDIGKDLIGTSVNHIDLILSSGLPEFKEEISHIHLSMENVTALRKQALVFQDLSVDFEGFKFYATAIKAQIESKKTTICKNILAEASVPKGEYKTKINVNGHQQSLLQFSCALYDNEHILASFKERNAQGETALSINENTGDTSHFIFKRQKNEPKKTLYIDNKISNDESIEKSDAIKYMASLILPRPSGRPDSKGVRECDRLAADPHDKEKLAQGVDFESRLFDPESFDLALDACIAAIENEPENYRQLFQLGRLLWYAGDTEMANDYLSAASTGGYAAASYYKAELLFNTSDEPNAFIDAVLLFEESGNGGYALGKEMAKTLNPDGAVFYKETPPPTQEEALRTLNVLGKKTAYAAGISLSTHIETVEINSCFQISATDFSCEILIYKKCSAGGGKSAFSFITNMVCGYLEKEMVFPTFRKLDDGGWKEIPSEI